MIEKIKNVNSFDVQLNNGVDETSAVTESKMNRLVEMTNWRISPIGDRIQKRDGLTQISTFGGYDVYSYHTYYDSSSNFCQLVVTEKALWRKVAAGAWTSIHTWSSDITHPVKIMEIQGKQIIINNVENKQILADGTLVGLGIAAPTTIPTIAVTFDQTLLDEDCAGITDWTDDDAGSGASTQVTYDSKSCFRFLNTGSSGDEAGRYRTVSGIGAEYTVELKAYINTIGQYQNDDHLEFTIYNGRVKLRVRIDQNDVYVYSGSYWVSAGCTVWQDKWVEYKFYVNTKDPNDEYVEVYRDGVSFGTFYCADKDTSNTGKVDVRFYGSTASTDAYFDYIKIGSTDGGNLNGLYRYAVAYARSGNYPNNSNPIKSLVGTATQTGSGLDDLTTGGTYTGSKDKNFRVRIDGTGATDTFEWSEDEGKTWASTDIPMTSTAYLPYGIELTWGATTGHTLADYWDFTCSSLSASACHQKVTLSSIPTSSDSQVDQRWIYRTQPGGALFYLLAKINDNTTTAYVDNVPDSALGSSMSEDHDVPPTGRYLEWFDDRLWIADHNENIIYYSKANYPDAFDTSSRYISVRRGEIGDKLSNIRSYKSHLYVFKTNSILFIRKKPSGNYGRYGCTKAYGLIAPWSLVEAYDLLVFLSYRGIEVFNGCNSYPIEFSLPVRKTIRTIDKTKLDYVTSVHQKAFTEVWISVPDVTGGGSAITFVYNYVRGGFYYFQWHKTPSWIGEIQDSSKEEQVCMGTRDGYLFTCDSGTQDGSTNITATARTSWVRFNKYANILLSEFEHECPTGKALTVSYYVNMQKTAVSTRTLSGNTPTATDKSIRLPIKDYLDTALRGRYLSLKFSNAEAVGSDLKLNWFRQFYATYVRNIKIKAD